MRKTALLLASIALALVLGGGVALAAIPADAGEGSAEATATAAANGPDARLDRALKELVRMEGGPPGVIAVVQRGDQREVHTFGVANLDNGRPMRADDRMRIASTAKAFSGAVALSLVSNTDELSLDDTIDDHLWDQPDPPPEMPEEWLDVTLRQLLNHTSGLPDFSQEPSFQNEVGRRLRHPDPPDELLTYVYDHEPPLLFDPGSEYQYSNSDNIAVALMVEEATGTSYENQLKERVYRPLGLRRTSLPVGPELSKPFIHGYDLSESPPEDISEALAAGWAWASGGLVSTPADLNTFIRGYVGGELFDLETRAEQRDVFGEGNSEPQGPGANSAGLGVFRYETRCGTVWGHTGNTAGYTQFMAASPNGRRSVTVSINAQIAPPIGDPDAFVALRRAETLAVCAALADKG
jgi:D-alanyl-D-alanine carboxypeptidase